MATFAEYTRNKKKKEAQGLSFRDYTKLVLGDAYNEDLGPVRESVALSEIAPVKDEVEERKWFEKGAFSDGYQFGDIVKTIAGSAADLVEDAGAGIAGMGEKAVDALLFAAPYVAQGQYYQNGGGYSLQQQKQQEEIFAQSKKGNQELIQKDLYNEEEIAKKIISAPIKSATGLDVEEASVFGEKTDSLAQSGGQLLATAGLQAAGVPWFLTTGATSFGAEAENALNQGATMEEAGLSAAVSAGAEILTEKLFGGIKFGGKTADDFFIKPLTEKISSKALRVLANLGVDAAGEGFEEVVSSVISNLGTALYKEENIGEILGSEEALDEYLESFIGGAVLGGGSSAISAVKAGVKENKLTDNEKKVVDKETADRIAEQETDGKKLTENEKKSIKEQVRRDLEKGYISTDTIESVLGGKTYESYKTINEREKALKEEVASLQGDPRPSAQNRLSEASAELEQIEKGTEKSELKDRLSQEVQSLTSSDRLSESYKEKARRNQVFEADLSKYDAKMQDTVKRAVDSGILNNTNRTHDFVDLIAKLSAQKGVSFDFMNNESLKKSGFAIDRKVINGLVKGNDIIINIDSQKALNTVVGHEITHVLEGTELYMELQNVVKEYATAKGEYDSRYQAVAELYKDIDGADIDAELTADLVGDYLFTDSDFVSKLSTEKPNIFKRIYEEIKYLCKVATAGSKQARELEKVKRTFDKAYKESTNTKNDSKVQYNVSEDANLYQYVKDALSGKLPKKSFYKISNKISDRLASDIEKIVGFSVKDYGNEISPNHIKHINDRHGENGKSDHSMKDISDLARIGYVIENYDRVIKGDINREYRNKDGSYSQNIVLQKKIDDNYYYVVEAVPDANRKTLHVVSAYINKNDTFPAVGNADSPTPDVQNAPQSNASFYNNSIPQKSENTSVKNSVSKENQDIGPVGNYNVYGKDIALEQDIGPVRETTAAETAEGPRADNEDQDIGPVARILTKEPEVAKKKSRFWTQAAELTLDKGFVFENLSKKTKNRELEAKWNYIRYADGRAQDFIGKGAEGVRALNDLRKEVEGAGLKSQLYDYVYHLHNADRMTLADRYENVENKAVFGESVTADVSKGIVSQLEAQYPVLKKYANEIYSINNYLRGLLVDGGVISQETADLWAEMYPHYVPIRRAGDHGLNVNVPLDTGRTGVNAPVKRATGGSSDILPLFDTMAQRALQTYKAVARNRFGVELKNTLGTTIGAETADVDSVIEGIDQDEELLQKGKNGKKPTFTVFENGERVTFEITDDMYDALKPTNEVLSYTIKPLNKAMSLHRGVLTEYSPTFITSNPIRDVQDVLINSQHPVKTYGNFPKAIKEMTTKGKWYQEYLKNGGEQDTYFDKQTNTFKKDKSKFVKVVGMPLNAISVANNFIERLPRLAEYITSRESGRSIEVSMLDSARVTTNFNAGGDLTKFLNRNGATFLNASVQGVMQQVRNVREAKMNGLKGWIQLAAKYTMAGLPVVLLNGLLWDDDEDYEELSDYVKQNYYVVAKYGDGKFVRIPKGRTLAVIQNAFEQTQNLVTGDDDADLQEFLKLAVGNLAPNNPVEDNIIAPIIQQAANTTWYDGDLVPTRLQDLPAEEQYDESIDEISKWLGEKLHYSPYKINYLLDQYSGGIGDSLLPMITPEAETGDDSTIGKITAPIRDKFVTDSVLKNQNVSDFYDKADELTTNAKSSKATDEDILSNKYFNSKSTEIGELYAEKREIQSSDLSDSEKYYLVRELQKQINALAKEALSEYSNVNIEGSYSTVGDKQYRRTENGWTKITDDQVEKQEKVTSTLGITPTEYWVKKEEYDYAYDNPGRYAVSKVVGGYETYKKYSKELYDIKSDKDADGKYINGSRKEKVLDYINNLDADYGTKIILFKSEYNADNTYNADIVEYLSNRTDITYEEMVTILEALDFKVYSDGTVEW